MLHLVVATELSVCRWTGGSVARTLHFFIRWKTLWSRSCTSSSALGLSLWCRRLRVILLTFRTVLTRFQVWVDSDVSVAATTL